MSAWTAFQDRMGAINDVLNAVSVLQWDQRTMMPAAGAATRGKQIATLVGVARDMLLADAGFYPGLRIRSVRSSTSRPCCFSQYGRSMKTQFSASLSPSRR
jgi:hypothetical protein